MYLRGEFCRPDVPAVIEFAPPTMLAEALDFLEAVLVCIATHCPYVCNKPSFALHQP